MNPFRTSFKHLPGRHDQQTHGNRGTRASTLRSEYQGETISGFAKLPTTSQSDSQLRQSILDKLQPMATEGAMLDIAWSKFDAENKGLWDRLYALKVNPALHNQDEIDRIEARLHELIPEGTRISTRQADIQKNQVKITLDALAVDNPAPAPELEFDDMVSLKARKQIADTLERVRRLIPAEKPATNSEFYTGNLDTTKNLKFAINWKEKAAGFYDQASNMIAFIDPKDYVIAHEIGHWIESTTPGARDLAYAYLVKKSNGLTQDKDDRSEYYIDDFVRSYMGRVYHNAQYEMTATEFISTGIEELFTRPYQFLKKDPESFDLLIKLIRGKIGLAQKHLRGRHDQQTHGNRGVRARFLPDPEDVLGIDPSDRVARGEAKYRTPVPGSPREKIMNELGEAEVLRERLTNELTKTLKEVRLAGRKRFDYERYYNRSGEYGSDFSSHPEWVKARDDHEALEKKATEMITALSQIQKEQVEKVIAILAVPNSYPVLIGTRLQDTKHSSFTEEDRAIIAKTTEQVMRLIPANRPTQIPPELKVKLDPTKQIQLDMSSFPDSNYGQYNVMFNSIALVVPQSHILAHELGHWAASVFPGIFESEHEFLKLKSRGRKVSKFGRVFYPDSYVREYTGRVYPNSDGKVSATEFLSTSLEEIFTRPYYFAKHFPASFDLAIKLLRGET